MVTPIGIAVLPQSSRFHRRGWPGGALLLLLLASPSRAADWPMVRGNAEHTGRAAGGVRPPFHLAWSCEFEGERLGTALEPIVAAGRVFVATQAGRVHALDAATGEPRWSASTAGPCLHGPAVEGEIVVVGSEDGWLRGLDAARGTLRWATVGDRGGFAAAPVTASGRAVIGSRAGRVFGVDTATGRLRWTRALAAPVRQTAAIADARVYVTAEDLRVRCLDLAEGTVLWESEALPGQTARDYYPVVTEVDGRPLVVVRTNPTLEMARHLARDRAMLCRQAGVDDRDWRTLEAWTRSDAARGNPELWRREQAAIRRYLTEQPDAQTFHVLDALTGHRLAAPPVLWTGGCQGVGGPPAVLEDGRLIVVHRSAYGHWNLGVAPLIGLGVLEPVGGTLEPFEQTQGPQPPWNTFWGTADETQMLGVAGATVLVVHQGTLSGYDREDRRLFPIHGARDTYGGFANPPWARNEWHGPARGGVAVVGDRIYWIAGSRLLCIAAGTSAPPSPLRVVRAASGSVPAAASARVFSVDELREELEAVVAEVLARRWAPLWFEPGLAGREFLYDHSAALIEVLTWAYPLLTETTQRRVREFVRAELHDHFPLGSRGNYALAEGAGREWAAVPLPLREPAGPDLRPHRFAGVYALWRYGESTGAWEELEGCWPLVVESLGGFLQSGWRLDGVRGDLHANHYLAALVAVEAWAKRRGDAEVAARAKKEAEATLTALVTWWERTATTGTLTQFKGVAQLDPFIGQGDGLSLRVRPHRHRVALFQGLTPEVAAAVRERVPKAVERVWRMFADLCATWWVVGEERQVHYGENYVDSPDLAWGAFGALAWLQRAPPEELARRVDLPFCRADLNYLAKLAVALEAQRGAATASAAAPGGGVVSGGGSR